MMSGPRFADTSRRVVITGMGVIAPSGRDLDTFWDNVRAGRSAAGQLTRFDPNESPSRLAAEVHDWDPLPYMEAKTAKRSERSLQYGIAAAVLAARDAKLDFAKIDPDRAGIVEATSLSNLDAAYRAREALDARGLRAVSPSMMLNGYVGSGSAEIANQLGFKGHAITCSSSSASGNDVVGYAMRMIQQEEVDLMLAGGAEAPLVDTVYFGFAQSRAMTRWSGPPAEAMKPFDQRGDGFVMGEAGAYLVLEELSHALGRGAKIYAEVVGQGRSCEAYHPMAPHPDGWGVGRAMEKAFRMARIAPEEVDYINPHGSANAVNDIAETRAIKTIFGPHARRLAVTSTKPITGHPLAAAGALEAVICALAIKNSEIPPTLNLEEPLQECDLDYVPRKSRPYPIRVAMSLNSGFGGKASCMILRRFDG
jgi:3-oxoacyl-[acyl-carrier-protein] synthase II